MRQGRTCALAALLLGGCFIPHRVISRSPEPSATVQTIRTLEFDRQRASLLVELELTNPGPALAFTEATYEVWAQGRSFAAGVVRVQVEAPAGGRQRFSLPVLLTYLELPTAARNRLKARAPVQLAVRGALRGEAGARVEFDGETEAQPTGDAMLP